MTRRLSAAYTFLKMGNIITRFVIRRRDVHYLFNYGSINLAPLKTKILYPIVSASSYQYFFGTFYDQQISSQK